MLSASVHDMLRRLLRECLSGYFLELLAQDEVNGIEAEQGGVEFRVIIWAVRSLLP